MKQTTKQLAKSLAATLGLEIVSELGVHKVVYAGECYYHHTDGLYRANGWREALAYIRGYERALLFPNGVQQDAVL